MTERYCDARRWDIDGNALLCSLPSGHDGRCDPQRDSKTFPRCALSAVTTWLPRAARGVSSAWSRLTAGRWSHDHR